MIHKDISSVLILYFDIHILMSIFLHIQVFAKALRNKAIIMEVVYLCLLQKVISYRTSVTDK